MGFDELFGMSKVKNWMQTCQNKHKNKILAISCLDDFIQTFLILPPYYMFRIAAKLEEFVKTSEREC